MSCWQNDVDHRRSVSAIVHAGRNLEKDNEGVKQHPADRHALRSREYL
jgi:hypothetical protein